MNRFLSLPALRSGGTAALLVLGAADLIFLNTWVFPRTIARPRTSLTSVARPAPALPSAAPPATAAESISSDARADGAPLGLLETKRAYFARNARLLDRAGEKAVRALAVAARRHPAAKVVVAGHTDETGPDAFNDWLSLARANEAAARLTALGVPRDRVVVRHFGASRPAVAGEGPRAWRRNRRVELSLMMGGGQ